MCKKILKFFVYSSLIILSISAISIIFLLPKDDFKKCECEELDSSLNDFFESKFKISLNDTLHKSVRLLKADKYNKIIIYKPTVLEYGQYQAYTNEVKGYFTLDGMGITNEYSFIKHNMEISYHDIFMLTPEYLMTNLIMLALKSAAYQGKSNALFFESKEVNFLINHNQHENSHITFDANIYFENGMTSSIILINSKKNISLQEFKRVVCSQIKLHSSQNEGYTQ